MLITPQKNEWEVFSTNTQLDFSTLAFVPPSNYSGIVNLTFESFSQTLSGGVAGRVYTSPTSASLFIADAAELPSFVASPAAVTGLEDAASIAFDLGAVLDKTKFTDLGETVNIEVQLASAIQIFKGSAASALVPASVSSGVATYIIPVPVKDWNSALYEGTPLKPLYSLKPGLDVASSGGTSIALADRIKIKATSVDSSGVTSQAVETTLNLNITPVADKPAAPNVLRAATTIDEAKSSCH